MARIELIVPENKLHLRKTLVTTIWGDIHFKIDDLAFPDSIWSDFVGSIVGGWLYNLLHYEEGSSIDLSFMDGSYHVEITPENDKYHVRFVHGYPPWAEIKAETDIDSIDEIMSPVVNAVKLIIKVAIENSWPEERYKGFQKLLLEL